MSAGSASKRSFQFLASLVLLVTGTVVATFFATEFFARWDCDERFHEYIMDLDKDGGLSKHYRSIGQEQYFRAEVTKFRPSGGRFSGNKGLGLWIVGGGAVAVLGLAGLWDERRRRKGENSN